MTNAPILVLGATGKTGRRVSDRLTAQGHAVRAGSRPSFDWEDRATWTPALAGAGAVYVSYFPDLAIPGAAETVAAFAAEARHVERLVLLSGRGEPEAQRAEDLVRTEIPQTTVVRCSFFAQNFSEGAWREEVLSGRLALPVDVAEPFVDCDDIADVAVAALTEPGHEGELYELTGPELLTFAQAAQVLGIAFEQIPLDAWQQAMAEYGVPDEVVGLLTYLFTEVFDGRNAFVADGVQRALGRPPRSLADAVAGAFA